MTSSTEALAAIRADLANACVPNPETLRVIRAVPKLLAIAEAAARYRAVVESRPYGARVRDTDFAFAAMSDSLDRLTSEETPGVV